MSKRLTKNDKREVHRLRSLGMSATRSAWLARATRRQQWTAADWLRLVDGLERAALKAMGVVELPPQPPCAIRAAQAREELDVLLKRIAESHRIMTGGT